ncbi:hypothetical protein KCP69_25885 [Salmonella enterica subsp. enterica]|nr:hypothetical protein KCP69_25885 [Salmonella enterica subsp. enterica]
MVVDRGFVTKTLTSKCRTIALMSQFSIKGLAIEGGGCRKPYVLTYWGDCLKGTNPDHIAFLLMGVMGGNREGNIGIFGFAGCLKGVALPKAAGAVPTAGVEMICSIELGTTRRFRNL